MYKETYTSGGKTVHITAKETAQYSNGVNWHEIRAVVDEVPRLFEVGKTIEQAVEGLKLNIDIHVVRFPEWFS